METSYLEEFVDLTQTLSFTQTARNMHVAQPTLSKHITMLEHDFNATLLNRSSSTVSLTEEGLCLLAAATDALDALEFARKTIADIKAHHPIKVNGRFDDPAVLGIITTASSKMGDAFPAVALEHSVTKSPTKMLVERSADIVIDLAPNDADLDRFFLHQLFTRPLVAIVGRGHPLAAKDKLTFSDLRDYTLLRMLRTPVSYEWDSIERICRESGFEPKTHSITVSNYREGLVHQLDDCVLIYPSASKELKYLAMTDRVILPFSDELAHFTVYAFCRNEDAQNYAPLFDAMDEAAVAFGLSH